MFRIIHLTKGTDDSIFITEATKEEEPAENFGNVGYEVVSDTITGK